MTAELRAKDTTAYAGVMFGGLALLYTIGPDALTVLVADAHGDVADQTHASMLMGGTLVLGAATVLALIAGKPWPILIGFAAVALYSVVQQAALLTPPKGSAHG